MTRRRVPLIPVLLATAVIAAVTLVAVLAGCGGGGGTASSGSSTPPLDTVTGFAGAALPGSPARHPFTLADQSGRSASLDDFRGQVTVLAFLSSACGAACVLIAQQIRGALDELAHPVPVLFVSADPRVDTRARVARFLAQVSLAGRAHYLTGAPATLRAVWRAYRVTPAAAGRTAFDRAATVRLLDRGGRERVLFGLEQLTPEGLSHDIHKLAG